MPKTFYQRMHGTQASPKHSGKNRCQKLGTPGAIGGCQWMGVGFFYLQGNALVGVPLITSLTSNLFRKKNYAVDIGLGNDTPQRFGNMHPLQQYLRHRWCSSPTKRHDLIYKPDPENCMLLSYS